jgi:hypothetical protein
MRISYSFVGKFLQVISKIPYHSEEASLATEESQASEAETLRFRSGWHF